MKEIVLIIQSHEDKEIFSLLNNESLKIQKRNLMKIPWK